MLDYKIHFRIKKILLLIIFGGVSFFTTKTNAQDRYERILTPSLVIEIEYLSINNELPFRNVNCVFQDSKGFMWLGTNEALVRYDGQSFLSFPLQKNIGIKDIHEIIEDKDGNLWLIEESAPKSGRLGCYVGVFDVEKEIFFNISSLSRHLNNDEFFRVLITGIGSAKDNSIVFTTKERLYVYKGTKEIESFSLEEKGLKFHFLVKINEHNQILTKKVTFLKKSKQQFFCFINYQGEVLKEIVGIRKLQQGRSYIKDKFWAIRSVDEFIQIDKEGIKKIIDIKKIISKKVFEETLNYKIAKKTWNFAYNKTNKWFWYFSKVGKPFLMVSNESGLIYNFSNRLIKDLGLLTINSIFFDNYNQTWICTEDGIYIIKITKRKFETILFNDKMQEDRISTRQIIKDKNGNLIVCTYSGVLKWKSDTKATEKLNFFLEEKYLTYSVFQSKNEELWFGSNRGIVLYNQNTGESKVVSFTKEEVIHVWSLYFDMKKERLWIGTSNGLYYLEKNTGKIQKFDLSLPNINFSNVLIYSFFKDNKDQLWLTTELGLFLLDLEKKRVEQIFILNQDTSSTCAVYHIYQDKDDIYWLATSNHGLVKWNPKNGQNAFTSYKDIINISKKIYAVYEDEFGALWLSSDHGIIQFDQKEEKIIHTYQIDEGISHEEFNRNSHFKNSNGDIYFGSLNGITKFNPKNFYSTELKKELSPIVLIQVDKFDIDKKKILDKTKAFNIEKKITLKQGERFLGFKFSHLDYAIRAKSKYEFRIKGLEEHWKTLNSNYLQLSGLPYGNFELIIRAKSLKGELSKNEINIPLSILKPFYYQAWFFLATLATFILIGYSINRFRLRWLNSERKRLLLKVEQQIGELEKDKKIINRQVEDLKHTNAYKTRFFTNVSHELRTPLTLILGPVKEIIDNKDRSLSYVDKNNLKLIERNGERLYKLIEEVLDISKMSENKLILTEEPTNILIFINQIFKNFEYMATSKSIQYILENSLSKEFVLLIDIGKTEKILYNLISNAFKYTPKEGRISIKIEEIPSNEKIKKPSIQISVSDTGPGIQSTEEKLIFKRFYQTKESSGNGFGIGLALAKELAIFLNGNIILENNLGQGAVFKFIFPKKESKLQSKSIQLPHLVPIEQPSIIEPEQQILIDSSPVYNRIKKNILFVEDNQDLRFFIKEILYKHYNVTLVKDGLEALEILEDNFDFDLILSDIMMPRMNGISLLKKIKANDKLNNIPIVLLTAKSRKEDMFNALRFGIDDYITKPFSSEELKARIANAILNFEERKKWQLEQPKDKLLLKGGISKEEFQWLIKVESICKGKIKESKFVIADLAKDLAFSERNLFRQIKKLTGLTPNQYIQEVRLQTARYFLENRIFKTVKEVSFEVGFLKTSYFTKLFKNRFGIMPKKFL